MQISRFLLVILMALTSCNSNKVIDIQGHRGCRGLLPENSLPAFKKAIELGVHTLEMDIAVTKDHKIIVSHEPFMSRTICKLPDGNHIPVESDKQYNLYQMTFDSIKTFDCGTKAHPRFPDQELQSVYKPLLSEVFEMTKAINPSIKYNIELKAKPEYDGIYTPNPKEFVALVMNQLKTADVFDRTNLQSFDLRILEEIKQQDANMEVALLIDEGEAIVNKLSKLSYTPEIISPYYKLLNAENVTELQAEGFKVIPWTINEISDMEQMILYGVDGIITDYPDRLIGLLGK
ncbi:glycerophosphodiester phosphodiesterase family protein [Winogradskyella sp. 3972H.M.0a.05]|uniref:glycerophosphodiester phosphodiesterase family protein n=1 Tax=Winogradskyella sp. 3972H.M.0a.05 TaxID=2950277 RepID=UPI003396003B